MKIERARSSHAAFVVAAAGLMLGLTNIAQAADCASVKNARIADTTIVSAETVPAGDFTTADKVTRKNLPAFCRVVASVKDAPDSDIRIELWLPNEGWKGVFHSNGNGGYGGIFDLDYGAWRRRSSAATPPPTPIWHGAGDPAQRRSRSIGHPAKMERLGDAFDACDDGRRQAYRQGFLWRRRQTFLLHRLLDRRPAGTRSKRSIIPTISTAFSPARRSSTAPGATPRSLGLYQAANMKPGHKLSDAKLSLLTKSAVAACSAKGNGLKSDPFIADPDRLAISIPRR